MKIVFTGGHHNSALVVAQALQDKGNQIFWFGAKHTIWQEKSLSAEYLEVKKHGFPFFEIKTGKFYRNYNPWQWLKIIFGFFQSLLLLIRLKPHLIVSFGGYLAVPVVLAGFLLRIPSVTHEQTTQVGLANQVISPFVKKIFVSWASSIKYLPKKRTELVGLPLRKEFFTKQKKIIFKNKLPNIFIIGGKQGSHFINTLIEEMFVTILNKYNLIHQTGSVSRTRDFFRLKEKRNSLPKEVKQHYLLKPYFFGEEMISLLQTTDLVISRSGAHIIYELAVLGKPAILIPFPRAYKNEQLNNALVLQKLGIAKILDQKETTSISLVKEIKQCFKQLEELKQNAKKVKAQIKTDATEKIVSFIEAKN